MSSIEKYCHQCDCTRDNEPCSKCIAWDNQCQGTCRCCTQFDRSLMPASTENTASSADPEIGQVNGSVRQRSSLSISFLGKSTVFPSPYPTSSTSHDAEPRNVESSETRRSTDSPRRFEKYCRYCQCIRGWEPCFDCIDWNYSCPGICVCCKERNGGVSSSHSASGAPEHTETKESEKEKDSEAACDVETLKRPESEKDEQDDVGSSDSPCLTVKEKSVLEKPAEEEDDYKHIIHCEMCRCIKNRYKCTDCILWDLNCTYTKNRLCTCCEYIERQLSFVD